MSDLSTINTPDLFDRLRFLSDRLEAEQAITELEMRFTRQMWKLAQVTDAFRETRQELKDWQLQRTHEREWSV